MRRDWLPRFRVLDWRIELRRLDDILTQWVH